MKEVLKEFEFDEWYKGYALWEDVDFSYRVGKKYKLAVVAEAKVLHLHIYNFSRERAAKIGDLEIVDRFYFLSKHAADMSFLMGVWASFGTIMRNLVNVIKYRNMFFLTQAQHNIYALLRCARGDIRRGF